MYENGLNLPEHYSCRNSRSCGEASCIGSDNCSKKIAKKCSVRGLASSLLDGGPIRRCCRLLPSSPSLNPILTALAQPNISWLLSRSSYAQRSHPWTSAGISQWLDIVKIPNVNSARSLRGSCLQYAHCKEDLAEYGHSYFEDLWQMGVLVAANLPSSSFEEYCRGACQRQGQWDLRMWAVCAEEGVEDWRRLVVARSRVVMVLNELCVLYNDVVSESCQNSGCEQLRKQVLGWKNCMRQDLAQSRGERVEWTWIRFVPSISFRQAVSAAGR